MHGPSDRGAVAPLQPRRQVEVARPLLQAGVGIGLERSRVAVVAHPGPGGLGRASTGSSNSDACTGPSRAASAVQHGIGAPVGRALVGEGSGRDGARTAGDGERRHPRRLPRGEVGRRGGQGGGVDWKRCRRSARGREDPGRGRPCRGGAPRRWCGCARASGGFLRSSRWSDTTRWSIGSGAGHVEEPEPLVVAHLLVDRDRGLELLGHHRLAHPVADPPAVPREGDLHVAPPGTGARRQAAHDGDRELEALGGVDGHDPHGVVVGLGQHRLGDPRALGGLLVDPVEVRRAGCRRWPRSTPAPGRSRTGGAATRRAADPRRTRARGRGDRGRCGRAARRATASSAPRGSRGGTPGHARRSSLRHREARACCTTSCRPAAPCG